MSKSLKFMLLGIAVLLFATAGSNLLQLLIFLFFNSLELTRAAVELIFPVAGLVFVLVGFFRRD